LVKVGEHLNEATTNRLGSIPESGNTRSHLDCRAALIADLARSPCCAVLNTSRSRPPLL
jgi:hypothetical protein